MKTKKSIPALMALILPLQVFAVDFSVVTIPSDDGLKTEVEAGRISVDKVRQTEVWKVEASARNTGDRPVSFKLVLKAEPRFRASRYLIPGVLYNGNEFVGRNILSDGRAFSLEMPGGWEKDGQPWIFAGDRSSIPACTISENRSKVFSLFASDADMNSITGSSSMEKLEDGSFRHLIYWPATEAPYSYTDKRKLTPRYDEYITLNPGESVRVTAYACEGRPLWENYGFATVFPVAWEVLDHYTPAQRTIEETVGLDLDYMKWTRRRNKYGSWFGGGQNDMVFSLGYMNTGKSKDGYSIEDYERDFTLDRWVNDDVEKSKSLAEGQYLVGGGASDIGFASQTFQRARLTIEYGLKNGNAEDVKFGIDVLDSWIKHRQQPCGLIRRGRKPKPGKTFTDASEVGWSISELVRTSVFLKENEEALAKIGVSDAGAAAVRFMESARKVKDAVLAALPGNGALGSQWDYSNGKCVSWSGDCGGYVLMGLVRYWTATRDKEVKKIIDKAFDYYFSRDIDRFECNGGAMDCSSVDREGVQPFLSAAVEMWTATSGRQYLLRARKAGWYMLSWVYLQNPVYPVDRDLYVYNWRPAGATIVGSEHAGLDDYGNLVIPELMALARADKDDMWREVAALLWRNGTQGFADEDRRIWHSMERPRGSKNEAWFPTRWSKYRTGENKRGSLNDHLMSWGGTYRLASLLELSGSDIGYLRENCPSDAWIVLENSYGRAVIDRLGACLRVWRNEGNPVRIIGTGGVSACWPLEKCVTPYCYWSVVSAGDSKAVLSLSDNESTRRTWPYCFRAEMEYRLGENRLTAEFRVTNTDSRSFECSDLLSAFFPREAVRAVEFKGGDPCPGRATNDGCVSRACGGKNYTLRPGETRIVSAVIQAE